MEVLKNRIVKSSQRTTDGCWVWALSPGSDGYGKIKFQRATLRAHRASWMAFRGDIPDGMLVCHKCDQPLCVNPDHLFLGTPQDNMSDKVKKNRWHGGPSTWKLDIAKVRLIRLLGASVMAKRWAQEFGVTLATIKHVKSGKTWTHVQ